MEVSIKIQLTVKTINQRCGGFKKNFKYRILVSEPKVQLNVHLIKLNFVDFKTLKNYNLTDRITGVY